MVPLDEAGAHDLGDDDGPKGGAGGGTARRLRKGAGRIAAVSAPVPQHCPTPVELDDLELLTMGAVPGVDGFNQPDSPLTLRLPDAGGAGRGRGRRGRAGRPRGPAAGPGRLARGDRRAAVPRRVRPVPAAPAQPRAVQGGVRRPHGRPGDRRPDRGAAGASSPARPGGPARPGRHRHPRAVPGRPDQGHPRRRRPAPRRRRRHRPPRRPRPASSRTRSSRRTRPTPR